MSNEVAERYAEALFELAVESNALREKKEDAETLLQILEDNPELSELFRAVKISRQEKKDLIEQIFGNSFEREQLNFLKLLVDKDRTDSLKDILKLLVSKANEELGIQTAVVYSVRKLPEEDLDRIRKALEKKTGKEVVLKNEIDERLIAGIKVVVGSTVTDVSMKRRLETMREALLKGGQV